MFPGVWVRVCTWECVCVCVCTPTYWDEPHPKTASGDDKHMGQEVHSVVAAVTEHVLPSMGALGGHSQPQAHPEGSPPSWHRPTLQMATWAGTGAHLVSESA